MALCLYQKVQKEKMELGVHSNKINNPERAGAY